MLRIIIPLLIGTILPVSGLTAKIKALIIDGQNNHVVWPKSTIMMKQYLEETGLFEVDLERTKYTWRGTNRYGDWLPKAGIEGTEELEEPKQDPEFSPDWADYDVVISNQGNNAAYWIEGAQKKFEDYMAQGGGFVSVHSANNSFPKWEEYNKVIGIGGWAGRKGHWPGAYVYYTNEGEYVRDEEHGKKVGAHGARHEFPMTVREPEHPIMKGLPANWMTGKDECYALLRGPAENLTILATGKDISESAVTDRHEPILMTIDYGEGRCFHTTLGHSSESYECVGFITTFLRGVQWAAKQEVTIPVPEDFPTEDKPSYRAFEYKE